MLDNEETRDINIKNINELIEKEIKNPTLNLNIRDKKINRKSNKTYNKKKKKNEPLVDSRRRINLDESEENIEEKIKELEKNYENILEFIAGAIISNNMDLNCIKKENFKDEKQKKEIKKKILNKNIEDFKKDQKIIFNINDIINEIIENFINSDLNKGLIKNKIQNNIENNLNIKDILKDLIFLKFNLISSRFCLYISFITLLLIAL